jgi:hypothetical protein
MQGFWEWLEGRGASHDIVEWARPYGAEVDRLWRECPRGDWLLAIATRLGVETSVLAQAACGCARIALPHVPDAEPRPALALQAAEAACRGELDARTQAEHEQHVSDALDAATTAASGAACVAVQSALRARLDRDAAVNAASFAAQASVLDAGDCAMLEALRFTQRQTAEAVRAAISPAQVAALWPLT